MRVLLVDGMSFLYRAFYGSKVERNSKGEPINALKKYLFLIDRFNADYPCDEIIICEDAPLYTLYRQKLFGEYKHGRKTPPEELLTQKKMLFGFLRKIGFPVIGISGYEADDIIGTLSKSLSEDGHMVLIASPDKDMYQLLRNDKIAIIQHNSNTREQKLLYRDDIFRDNGYWPEQVVDIKILSGDSSDNIPGVPHCGYRLALKLLQRYRSIENLIASEDIMPDPQWTAVRDYILKHPADIDMFRSIITINCDIDPSLISKQLAYQITAEIMDETLKRYEVMSPDNLSMLSFSQYLYNRLKH